MPRVTLFGGKHKEQYNILMEALEDCAKDENQSIYMWLDDVPRTSMIVFLVDKLHHLGYEIIKKNP